ncbi:hypothetical protein ACG83_10320 [Frankia sp. R43]|uniref:GntR family transcriptional regulator n=1 Tax=Frankia sp. R43 TaxID=269536 RepID=UPI0006CA40CB|nr:GntR family transcriptional regulator [Frankia sp. R43]KPM55675.1 hypothetical protein ACG83_10320 [Frankia sp. R43]
MSTTDSPRYPQIADDLRRRILRGDLAPGAKLPSERVMAEDAGVTRGTVREAIKVLRAEGLVVPVHGSGVFVRDQPRMIRLARNRLSRGERARTGGTFSADMTALGKEPRVDAEIVLAEADSSLALDLEADEGTPLLARRRRMYGDDTPMQLATSYFPADIARGTPIEQRDTGHGGVYARLEEMGHHLVTPFVERVGARAPSREEREWFGLAQGVPLLTVTRIARTAERPVEVNRMLMRADYYELVYEIPAD